MNSRHHRQVHFTESFVQELQGIKDLLLLANLEALLDWILKMVFNDRANLEHFELAQKIDMGDKAFRAELSA